MSLSQFLPIRDNLKLVFRLVMRGQIGVWTGHHFADNCDVQTIQVHRLRIIQIPNSPGFSTTPFVLVSITKWSMMETLTMRRKKKKYSLSTEATDTTTRWWKRHAILQFRGLLMDLLQTSICFPFFFSLSKVQILNKSIIWGRYTHYLIEIYANEFFSPKFTTRESQAIRIFL